MEELKRYLIELALRTYNLQFKAKYKVEDFDISIISHDYSTYAFNIYTKDLNDFFRLNTYYTVGRYTMLGNFRLQEIKYNHTGNNDEVFVAHGYLGDDFFTIYKNDVRRMIAWENSRYRLLGIYLLENGEPLLYEDITADNGYVFMEEALEDGYMPNASKYGEYYR